MDEATRLPVFVVSQSKTFQANIFNIFGTELLTAGPALNLFSVVTACSSLFCGDRGIILLSLKQISQGNWNESFVFIMPVVFLPSTTLQLFDLTESRTVSVADSQPRTITVSYFFAYLPSFFCRAAVHMQRNHW